MLRVTFSTNSGYSVKLPDSHHREEIISAARVFVAYETENVREAKQTPYTEDMRRLLEEIDATETSKTVGESRRLTASEEVKRLDKQLTELVSYIAQQLKARYFNERERAFDWGFEVKQSTGNIRLPKNRSERLALLDAYIIREQQQSETEQFERPALSEVIAVRDGLKQNLAIRDAGKTQRETGVASKKGRTRLLHFHLQAGAVFLLARLQYQVTPELQNWGFHVFEDHRHNRNGDAPIPIDVENETALEGEPM